MLFSYTARYTRLNNGYMGQIVEWPEVVTEGIDLDDCRSLLRDALNEMILAYQALGQEIPLSNALIEQIPVEVTLVSQNEGGSHHVFSFPGIEEDVCVPAHRPLKPVYVRRFVALVDQIRELSQ